jgi:hypothetical protein
VSSWPRPVQFQFPKTRLWRPRDGWNYYELLPMTWRKEIRKENREKEGRNEGKAVVVFFTFNKRSTQDLTETCERGPEGREYFHFRQVFCLLLHSTCNTDHYTPHTVSLLSACLPSSACFVHDGATNSASHTHSRKKGTEHNARYFPLNSLFPC